ncbi:alpha/beta hydrolase family protein [Nocardia sp. CY41]|uniref:alpha/beta hydrolase family protein n=1 Tax=Nocardia sp. CY41 TaxID=2608686 RepID=UPI00135A7F2A|nr:alpha/beta fold hydrolase [Nocardia sp. CY41]
MTGPYAVGNRRLFLTDPSRPDPFTGAAVRWVPVIAWYPTAGTGSPARYLSGNDSFDSTMALELTNKLESRTCFNLFGVSCFGVSIANTLHPRIRARDTRAVLNAPVHTGLGQLPVVVFSPGFGMPGHNSAILAQELASHGYLVLTMTHTWEAIVTELADQVAKQNVPAVDQQWAKCLNTRVADAKFLLDQLPTLPNGIGAQADLDKVGFVGHSYGGTTGMELAYQDSRVKAVAILDGPVGYPGTSNQAQDHGIPQPVMLLSGPVDPNDGYTTGAETAGWNAYAATNHGPLHRFQVAGAKHHAFTDIGLLTTKTAELCGTIAPARAMELHPRWTRAFLDTYINGAADPLLTLPAADWPEVTAI